MKTFAVSMYLFEIWLILASGFLEAATQMCSKMFWKYAANLLENSHTEMWFQ